MITLYYLANPPLVATGLGYVSEGHYQLVNKTQVLHNMQHDLQ